MILVAHRGYPAEYPENSIAAFEAAIEAGARWIEVDVQLDGGIPVLAHDPEFTGKEETVAEFARWLGARPEVTAFVDFKNESLNEYGVEPVVLSVMDVMAGNWHPISFNHAALVCAVKNGSAAPGWVVTKFNDRIAARALEIKARWLIINQIFMRPGPVTEGPWEWMVYEIENTEQALDMQNRGVRWLETMRYAEIARGLKRGS